MISEMKNFIQFLGNEVNSTVVSMIQLNSTLQSRAYQIVVARDFLTIGARQEKGSGLRDLAPFGVVDRLFASVPRTSPSYWSSLT